MDTDKIIDNCLKEMFRRVGMRYPNKKFTDQPDWYLKRCWTEKEEQDFEKWMRAYLRKCKFTPRMIDRELPMFMLMWGWKVNTEAL